MVMLSQKSYTMNVKQRRIDDRPAMPNNNRPSLKGNRDSIRQGSTPANQTLPEDIIIEILLHLPAEHLLPLRSVSKAWNAIISDKGFAEQHNRVSLLKHGDRRQDNIIIRYRYHCSSEERGHDVLHLMDLDPRRGGASKIGTELSALNQHCHIIGSCNGLLLLCQNYLHHYTLCVWNPLRNMILPIDTGSDPSTDFNVSYDYCFGYDNNKFEFKVVRVKPYESMVEVFTVPMKGVPGPWRRMESVPSEISFISRSTLVNNRLYWYACERGNLQMIWIISFDLGDEQFRALPSAPCLALNEIALVRSKITELEGCLSIFWVTDYNNGTPIIEVWVMEDHDRGDSWALRFSLNCHLTTKAYQRLEVIKCDEDEILIGDGRHLIAYNYKTHRIFDMVSELASDDQVSGNHGNITLDNLNVQVLGFVGNLTSPESLEPVQIK